MSLLIDLLIDTDTCSAYMKGNRAVVARFLQYGGRLNVSTVTVAELYAGVLRARASPRLLPALVAMLLDLTILDVTEDVARTFGVIRAPLLDQSLRAPAMDLLIAATALVHGLTLVTHNTQDYTNVPGLTMADWLIP
jgi:tRNA(fMet)-specific endonuclease VapC